MTTTAGDDPLLRFTQGVPARPLPQALRAARGDVLATIRDLRTISDSVLGNPWAWKGGGEEELRYGFYRIGETFELAAIDALAALAATQTAGLERRRAGDLIAPATAARWDLQGLLIPLADGTWDADPGGGEWTIRRTLGHVIGGQRDYGVGTAWWQDRALRADHPDLPTIPESIFEALPSEEVEGEGTPANLREGLDFVVDQATERLAGLPEDRLVYGARWSGFAVNVGFRLGRWSSHIREHTIQVEKTLVVLDLRPTEVDRLVRLVLNSWGRAEAVVFGAGDAKSAVATLAKAASSARSTARELATLAST